MCIYAQSPLQDPVPYLVHKTPPHATMMDEPANTTLKSNLYAFNDVPYSSGWEGAYSTSEAPVVPNGRYAIKGHPSDTVVAYDSTISTNGGLIYMDQTIVIHGPSGTRGEYSKTVERLAYLAHDYGSLISGQRMGYERPPMGVGADGNTILAGTADCTWIRHCDTATERLGSPCNATLSGVYHEGFCFTSNTGSLECGHTTALDGNKVPVHTVFRCPSGSPARSLGTFTTPRMRTAGCMLTSDSQYDPYAEIHVPEFCAIPADYRKGCLLKGAENYDVTAKQEGVCTWLIAGCMSSTALNYNPVAVADDPLHPCIEPIRGCTIPSRQYAGVPQDTPGYRSDYFGSARRGVGIIPELQYNGPATLNYDDTATVLHGCVLGIEGCMDPTAVNYDSRATVNSGTWCIPRVPGCMMPTDKNANAAYANPDPTSNAPHMQGQQPDGLNANFSIGATFHDPSYCVLARYGCGASGAPTPYQGYAEPIAATNYDPAVTVETRCYWPRPGCLNPQAINFGCDTRDSQSPCFYDVNVTVHVPAACLYAWDINPASPSPPAPPPSPPFPPGVVLTYLLVVGFSVGGTVDYFTDDVKETALNAFKVAISAEDLNVTLDVYAGSVNLDYSFASENVSAVDEFEDRVTVGIGATAASAQVLIGDAIGVQVLSGASMTRSTIVTTPNVTKTDPGLGTAGTVLLSTFLGLFGCCCCCGCLYLCCIKDWSEKPKPQAKKRKKYESIELKATKEKPKEVTLVRTLSERFPGFSQAEIEAVLRENEGHAGKAAKALSRKVTAEPRAATAISTLAAHGGASRTRVHPE